VLEATCQPTDAVEYRPGCAAQVQDISRGGLRIVVPRRIDPETFLTVGIESTADALVPAIQVRVVHATQTDGGPWVLGCAFLRPLSEEELQSLL
jgi:hypothetical protein